MDKKHLGKSVRNECSKEILCVLSPRDLNLPGGRVRPSHTYRDLGKSILTAKRRAT